jgi:hypothetical protein
MKRFAPPFDLAQDEKGGTRRNSAMLLMTIFLLA